MWKISQLNQDQKNKKPSQKKNNPDEGPKVDLSQPELSTPERNDAALTIIKEVTESLSEITETSPQNLFDLVVSSTPANMVKLHEALKEIQPYSIKNNLTAESIKNAVDRLSREYKLTQQETRVLRLSLLGPGQGQGLSPKPIINNPLAQFVYDANALVKDLKITSLSTASDIPDIKFEKTMMTQELRQKLEILSAIIDTPAGAGSKPALKKLQHDIIEVEINSIITSIIARSHMTQDGQKLIIAIETDWIPGINDKTDRGYGSNHQAINPLLRELDSLGDTLKKIGLANVEIIQESSRDIEAKVLARAADTNTSMKNIVILGSNTTIDQIISAGTFTKLTPQGEERAFLAGIDPTELIKSYSNAKAKGSYGIDVSLIQMLSIALELSLGKEPPILPIIVSYDKNTRLVIFLPKAQPIDYKLIQELYAAQKQALSSL